MWIAGAVVAVAALLIGGFVVLRGEADQILNNVNNDLASSGATLASARPAIVPLNCPSTVTDLVDALRDLDSRLGVGLNFQSYSQKVGDVKVAYDRIEVDKISAGCLQRVAVPAENALNAYLDAYNTWNDCVADVNCTNESITSELQSKWAAATADVDQAVKALEE